MSVEVDCGPSETPSEPESLANNMAAAETERADTAAAEQAAAEQ